MDDLKAIASQHIDYIEVDYGDLEYGPMFVCDRCQVTADGVWSDLDAMYWDDADNTYRLMAEHWRTEHQEAG
jgi:hypothetical protein